MIRYLYKKHKAKKAREAVEGGGSSTAQNHAVAETGTADGGEKAVGAVISKAEPDAEPSGLSKEESKRQSSEARKYRWKLVGGLFLPYFIASTDLTSTL